MSKCKFKTSNYHNKEWKCSNETLPGDDYCYWHKQIPKKLPSKQQLKELNGIILNVYLKKADLIDADLWKANLMGANLQEANLSEANLREANLQDANLNKAYLDGVNLQEANLRGANLIEAQLEGADLQQASLSFANLEGADLEIANLQEADLQDANLQHANLQEANLRGADLSSANLKEADLWGANLQKTKLWGTNFQGYLIGTNFQGAELWGANLQSAGLKEANLQEANLMEVNLQGADLHCTKFDSKTILDKSILIGANLFQSYFDETKSFRNALVFQKEGDKEINEIVGDTLDSKLIRFLERFKKYSIKLVLKLIFHNKIQVITKIPLFPLRIKPCVIYLGTIAYEAPSVIAELRENNLIRYARTGEMILFLILHQGAPSKIQKKGIGIKETL